MLRLHLQRLADIALTEQEPDLDRPPGPLSAPCGARIEVRGLSFHMPMRSRLSSRT